MDKTNWIRNCDIRLNHSSKDNMHTSFCIVKNIVERNVSDHELSFHQ